MHVHVSIYRKMQEMKDTYHRLIRHNVLHVSVKEGYCYSFPIRTHFFPRPIWKEYEVTAIFQNLFNLTNSLQRSVLRHHIQLPIDLSLQVSHGISDSTLSFYPSIRISNFSLYLFTVCIHRSRW